MRCIPLSVLTTLLSSLIFRAKAACSKAGCILPRPNFPRSPPCSCELQSDSFLACLSNSSRNLALSSMLAIFFRSSLSSYVASSTVRLITFSLQEDGRRDSVCFFKRWRTRTWVTGLCVSGIFSFSLSGATESVAASGRPAKRPPRGSAPAAVDAQGLVVGAAVAAAVVPPVRCGAKAGVRTLGRFAGGSLPNMLQLQTSERIGRDDGTETILQSERVGLVCEGWQRRGLLAGKTQGKQS
mmetsp:Transcript_33817/g.73150  ORF Transcript_33817/g.73150 Transcript_33817/m.73150 type:complete len:240 (-) Transcript_33817:1-720(-)